MTTVTEAAKRLGDDLQALEGADLAAIKSDPVLAQQLARRLAGLARHLLPSVTLSVEDLRDVLDVAVQGQRGDGSRIVEGRYLRKRVREMCAYADRYGESFAVVVLRLAPEPAPGLYPQVVERLVEKLRRSDLATVYRRRVAMLLPRMQPEAIGPLLVRVSERLDEAARCPVVRGHEWLVYPSSGYDDTQAVLDWLEDQLRVD